MYANYRPDYLTISCDMAHRPFTFSITVSAIHTKCDFGDNVTITCGKGAKQEIVKCDRVASNEYSVDHTFSTSCYIQSSDSRSYVRKRPSWIVVTGSVTGFAEIDLCHFILQPSWTELMSTSLRSKDNEELLGCLLYRGKGTPYNRRHGSLTISQLSLYNKQSDPSHQFLHHPAPPSVREIPSPTRSATVVGIPNPSPLNTLLPTSFHQQQFSLNLGNSNCLQQSASMSAHGSVSGTPLQQSTSSAHKPQRERVPSVSSLQSVRQFVLRQREGLPILSSRRISGETRHNRKASESQSGGSSHYGTSLMFSPEIPKRKHGRSHRSVDVLVSPSSSRSLHRRYDLELHSPVSSRASTSVHKTHDENYGSCATTGSQVEMLRSTQPSSAMDFGPFDTSTLDKLRNLNFSLHKGKTRKNCSDDEDNNDNGEDEDEATFIVPPSPDHAVQQSIPSVTSSKRKEEDQLSSLPHQVSSGCSSRSLTCKLPPSCELHDDHKESILVGPIEHGSASIEGSSVVFSGSVSFPSHCDCTLPSPAPLVNHEVDKATEDKQLTFSCPPPPYEDEATTSLQKYSGTPAIDECIGIASKTLTLQEHQNFRIKHLVIPSSLLEMISSESSLVSNHSVNDPPASVLRTLDETATANYNTNEQLPMASESTLFNLSPSLSAETMAVAFSLKDTNANTSSKPESPRATANPLANSSLPDTSAAACVKCPVIPSDNPPSLASLKSSLVQVEDHSTSVPVHIEVLANNSVNGVHAANTLILLVEPVCTLLPSASQVPLPNDVVPSELILDTNCEPVSPSESEKVNVSHTLKESPSSVAANSGALTSSCLRSNPKSNISKAVSFSDGECNQSLPPRLVPPSSPQPPLMPSPFSAVSLKGVRRLASREDPIPAPSLASAAKKEDGSFSY